MKKREKLFAVVVFFMMFLVMSLLFVEAEEIILGQGNTENIGSSFYKLANAEGLDTGATYHFSPDEQTARKLCLLTEEHYEILGLPHPYTGYDSYDTDNFEDTDGDYIYKWSTEWETINAVDNMLWEVTCEEDLCDEKTCLDYPGQCGLGLDDGCGGTIDCLCGEHSSCDAGSCVCDAGWIDSNGDIAEGNNGDGCETEEGGEPPEEEVYWADLAGNHLIDPDNYADVGDSVLMIYLNADSNYDFNIYEKDIGFDDIIKTVSGILDNTNLYGSWTITSQDWENYEVGTPEFIFKTNELGSGELNVNEDKDNSMPSTEITKPIKEKYYSVNKDILFEQISSDKDDFLNLTWDFGDNEKQSFTNCFELNENMICDSGDGDTTHSYSNEETGTKIIKLIAEEVNLERNPRQRAEDYSRVYIVKPGLNAIAIINEPSYDAINTYDEGGVDINGESSKIVKCFGNEPDCIADGSGSNTCFPTEDLTNPLYCYIYKNFDEINFKWDYYNSNNEIIDSDSSSSFTKIFSGPEQYKISLTIDYTETEIEYKDNANVSIVVKGSIECDSSGEFWKDMTQSPMTILRTTGENPGNCYNPEEGIIDDYCCPSGYQCKDTGEFGGEGYKFYECVYVANQYCGDLKSESDCKDYKSYSFVAENTAKYFEGVCGIDWSTYEEIGNQICYDYFECGCVWDNNPPNDEDARCEANQTNEYRCIDAEGGNSMDLKGSCTIQTEFDSETITQQCEERGYYQINYIKIWEWDGDCPRTCASCLDGEICKDSCCVPSDCDGSMGTAEGPCENIKRLNFFNYINFVLVILIIFICYFIYFKKTKN